MLFIVSPTKTMKTDGCITPCGCPCFLTESKQILTTLQHFSEDEIARIMKVNEKIAQQNKQRYQEMKFDEHGKCAIESYDGLQFKYMHFASLTAVQQAYLQEHMRIISGFYGVVAPMDSIYPYRLEMQAKISVDGYANLYDFWGAKIADELKRLVAAQKTPYIINLASKEYEKAIRKYFDQTQIIDVHFLVEKNGKRKSEATAAKMARGEMIHFAACHQIDEIKDLCKFDGNGFCYDEKASSKTSLVFYKVQEV